jgi:hypothetical protein
MRRILIGTVVLMLAVATASEAQTRKTLDDPLGAFFVPNPLTPCAVATTLLELERSVNVLVGFERAPECSAAADWFPDPAWPTVDNLSGQTVRQVLDHITMLAPAYEWRDIDGIAVIRPFNAWNDNANALNAHADGFTITDGHLREGIAAALRIRNLNIAIADAESMSNRQFSVDFAGGTALDALNAVIRAHDAAMWDLGWLTSVEAGSHTLDIMVRTFDTSGFSVGTAIGAAQTAPFKK